MPGEEKATTPDSISSKTPTGHNAIPSCGQSQSSTSKARTLPRRRPALGNRIIHLINHVRRNNRREASASMMAIACATSSASIVIAPRHLIPPRSAADISSVRTPRGMLTPRDSSDFHNRR